ncbi:MAG: GNAT family N-acetyltransferase [Anaerolineae bacterium]|nr:GNAT family N-acetyltransferase [Anaerolineae bacterium]
MQAVRIRAATTSDLPDLSRLWHEKMVIHQQLDRHVMLAPDAESRWKLAAAGWLLDQQCAVFVADVDDEVLGYIVGRIQASPPGLLPESIGFITDLTVDAHRPGGGVGRLLLDVMRKWFLECGIEQVMAQVPASVAVEQAFWRAQRAVDWVDVMWLKL